MDIVRLGPEGNNTYIPDELVEGCTSKIWTERFQSTPGDFQLKTPYIWETMSLLEEGCLISHLETDEVMMVENHAIDLDADGIPELTVTGRSLTHFPEHRHVEAPYQKKRTMIREYRAVGAAAVLLWNAFDNNSGVDHTRLGMKPWTTKDRIPNVAIADAVSLTSGTTRRWRLEEGPLYPQLFNILQRGDLGLRMVRPNGATLKIVSVGNDPLDVEHHVDGVVTVETVTEGGSVTRTVTNNVGAMAFEIYEGTDRTDDVVFSVSRGDFERMQYLFSIQAYKTACEVMSSVSISDVYRSPAQALLEGLDRRVMSFDAGEPELPDEPERPEHPDEPKSTASTSEKDAYQDDMDDWRDAMDVWRPKHHDWELDRDRIVADFKADSEDDAIRQLKRGRKVSVFTADISPFSEFKYKTHYDLGDTVLLQGDYDQIQKLVVSEYVRTEDAEGDRGYPGLVLP